MLPSTLSSEHLVLRRWTADDRPAFAAMCADTRVMEFMPTLLSRSESDALVDRIDAHFDTHDFGLWALELVGAERFIGFTGLMVPSFEAHFTPCVEIGWRLDARYWGRGLATEAARAAIADGFGRLGLTELVAFTVPGNVRSRAVMDALGMVLDEGGTFDHPRLPAGHPLRRHLLYRLRRTC